MTGKNIEKLWDEWRNADVEDLIYITVFLNKHLPQEKTECIKTVV